MEEKYHRRKRQRLSRVLQRMIVRLLLVLGLLSLAAGLLAARKPEDKEASPPVTQPSAPSGTVSTQPTAPPTLPSTAPPTTQIVQDKPFFENAVFIGDSVTLALRNYCLKTGQLSGAQFLCAGNYSLRHGVLPPGGKDVVSLTYQGEPMSPAEALKACKADKAFLLLGMNDVVFGLDLAMKNWDTILQSIRRQCPDVDIYIQSLTPVMPAFEGKKLNNASIDAYNAALRDFAWQEGCIFVEVGESLKDENGALLPKFCSDNKCHLTDAGVQAWLQVLQAVAEGRA